jgi:hypothetical protein
MLAVLHLSNSQEIEPWVYPPFEDQYPPPTAMTGNQ